MDYSRYESLKIDSVGGVVTVTLNRPDVRNVVDEATHDELSTVFSDLDQDDDCEVVVLTGAGGYFCGGGDISWLLSLHRDLARTAHSNKANRRIQNSLLDLEKPIIAKVRGPAIGLGCSLALSCDFVLATPEARFADPHVAVGLVAGDGGTFLWPQLIGYARARNFLLTGDSLTGAEAADIGLITKAVPEAELDEAVDRLVERMLRSPRFAIRWTKSAINAGLKVTANALIDRAGAFENLTFMSYDNQRALEAFLTRTEPSFEGN